MKLWSKGLGRTEIDMDFRRYVITQDPESRNIRVSGHIVDPVKWEFRITLTPDDIPGIIKLALNPLTIRLLLLNCYRYIQYIFNRKKYSPADSQALLRKVDIAYDAMVNNSRSRARRRPTLGQARPGNGSATGVDAATSPQASDA